MLGWLACKCGSVGFLVIEWDAHFPVVLRLSRKGFVKFGVAAEVCMI